MGKLILLLEDFIRRKRHYFLSVLWLILIVLFTYTSLVHEFLKKEGLSIEEYCNNQHCGISMIVNLGLLGMVVFDYIGAAKRITNGLVVKILFATFLIYSMYVHTGILLSGSIEDYKYPLCEKWLSIVLHAFFFVILLIIKIDSMRIEQVCSNSYLRIKKSFIS